MLFTLNFDRTPRSPPLLSVLFGCRGCFPFPVTHTLPHTPSGSGRARPCSNSSQQFLPLVSPFPRAHVASSVAFFLHAYLCRKSLVHHMLQRRRAGSITGIFLVCSLCSVCQDNIGHRLLQKHGWKLGQGLGKSLQGKCCRGLPQTPPMSALRDLISIAVAKRRHCCVSRGDGAALEHVGPQ